MNLLMTQYAVEGVTKENKKLRKKLAKQQQEFNNYCEELANQVGEELAKQREEFNNFRVEMAKDMDELRGNLGCGPPLKQEVKTEAEFLNGHEYTFIGSASGEIVNTVIKCCAEVGDGGSKVKQRQRERVQKTRVDCKVCGGVSSTDKHRKLRHEKSSLHQKALGGGN
jgi:hypothetical protein